LTREIGGPNFPQKMPLLLGQPHLKILENANPQSVRRPMTKVDGVR